MLRVAKGHDAVMAGNPDRANRAGDGKALPTSVVCVPLHWDREQLGGCTALCYSHWLAKHLDRRPMRRVVCRGNPVVGAAVRFCLRRGPVVAARPCLGSLSGMGMPWL